MHIHIYDVVSSKLRGAALQSLYTLARNYDNSNWRDHVEEAVNLLLTCIEVSSLYMDRNIDFTCVIVEGRSHSEVNGASCVEGSDQSPSTWCHYLH